MPVPKALLRSSAPCPTAVACLSQGFLCPSKPRALENFTEAAKAFKHCHEKVRAEGTGRFRSGRRGAGRCEAVNGGAAVSCETVGPWPNYDAADAHGRQRVLAEISTPQQGLPCVGSSHTWAHAPIHAPTPRLVATLVKRPPEARPTMNRLA